MWYGRTRLLASYGLKTLKKQNLEFFQRNQKKENVGSQVPTQQNHNITVKLRNVEMLYVVALVKR